MLSCCAPCSCAALEALVREGARVRVLFYNPNIFPREEYEKRRDEQRRLCALAGAEFDELPYEPQVWEAAVKGLENEPERGKRCAVCFYLRLSRAAQYAREHKMDAFTSVLGVSRHKDLAQVNDAARRVWIETGKPYLARNWRKMGLEERRRELIARYGLYKQAYCGCPYSAAAAGIKKSEDKK